MRGRRKRAKGGLVEVGELLEGALRQLGVKGDFEKHRLEKACREALGPGFARGLTGVDQKGSVLRLSFDHAIWMNEVQFRKAEILRRLQKELPEAGIKDLTAGLAGPRRKTGK